MTQQAEAGKYFARLDGCPAPKKGKKSAHDEVADCRQIVEAFEAGKFGIPAAMVHALA